LLEEGKTYQVWNYRLNRIEKKNTYFANKKNGVSSYTIVVPHSNMANLQLLNETNAIAQFIYKYPHGFEHLLDFVALNIIGLIIMVTFNEVQYCRCITT
jgi:hypothetical protein